MCYCMARSANIDPLKFHNFFVGPKSIIVKYEDLKKDKDPLDRSLHLDSSLWNLYGSL